MPKSRALSGICPYFTMFPLEFPYLILRRYAVPGTWVLDPFCGRGTTNYASRILGLPSVGIDSSRVAVALSQAKLANTSPSAIVRAAQNILEEIKQPTTIPEGEFWEWAFERGVLHTLCRLREGLLLDCQSDARKALRAVLMGALHGPRPRGRPAYFSNQAPRTYAPKPRYATNYWKTHKLVPEVVDVLGIIHGRAQRYFGQEATVAVGYILQADSREPKTYDSLGCEPKITWVITSPPYYGMRTYVPDQWLRLWLLGGPPEVEYSSPAQIAHANPSAFASQLRRVWQNAGAVSAQGARLIVRFGAINDRKIDPLALITSSFQDSGWRLDTVIPAGVASMGRRQSEHFARSKTKALEEHDVWATWDY